MTISNERLATLFLNWWKMSEKDMTLSDMEDICKDIGMTRSEFVELVSRSNEFISKDGWTPELENNEKVKIEEVLIGDSDRAILETTLSQIGIPYSWEESNDGDSGWIDVKSFDDGQVLGNTSAEIYFTKEGKFTGIY